MTRRQFLAAAAAGAVAATWSARARRAAARPDVVAPPATVPSTAPAASPATARAPIDRKAVVGRHDVTLRAVDAATPLHVGNGDFAFGLDVTGLQTLAEHYRRGVPLHAMATWAWHADPEPVATTAPAATRPAAEGRAYDVPGRGPVVYADAVDVSATRPTTVATVAPYLCTNPHRAALGRVAFVDARGESFAPDAVTEVAQTLELWTGIVRSRFSLAGTPVEVTTAAHPTRPAVAFRIRSAALAGGKLGVRIAFPAQRVDASDPDDWSRPDAHRSTLSAGPRPGVATVAREQDAFRYATRLAWSTPDATRLTQDGPHGFTLRGEGDWLELCVEFAPDDAVGHSIVPPRPPATTTPTTTAVATTSAAGAFAGEEPLVAADVISASSKGWEQFWLDGAAIDFAGSADPRAAELERRVVRSQYLTAVHCAGATPAPETGLACNALFGKLRLDTAWWTGAHFAMWGRPQLLERSMRFFERALPTAQAQAARQGYEGARWPALCCPDGTLAPGEAAPFMIWQQPHAIYFAEQLYRATPSRETLDRYADLVAETARFMASFPAKAEGNALSLGPPVVPAQQRYTEDRATVRDPTFELAYWAWGLGVAQRWRERLGQPRDPRWDDVIKRLAKPTVRDGHYAAIGVAPFLVNSGHPSFLMALGHTPKTYLIDENTMRETARWTSAQWRWETAWGADFPVLAQTLCRLGDASGAVDALLRDAPANAYLANGQHAAQSGLPVVLSANGALLAAVAMMAGGWDGLAAAERSAASTAASRDVGPFGFPGDGKWSVRVEGFERLI